MQQKWRNILRHLQTLWVSIPPPNHHGPSICAEQRVDYYVHQTEITPFEFEWLTQQDPDPVIFPILSREAPVLQFKYNTTHSKTETMAIV